MEPTWQTKLKENGATDPKLINWEVFEVSEKESENGFQRFKMSNPLQLFEKFVQPL